MTNYEHVKAELTAELQDLHRACEELLLQSVLNHADVRPAWDRLDDAMRSARTAINQFDSSSSGPLSEIEQSTRALLGEVKQRLNEVRRMTGARPSVTLTDDFVAVPPVRPGT